MLLYPNCFRPVRWRDRSNADCTSFRSRDEAPIVREVAPSRARLLPGHFCVRIGCVSIRVPVAQDLGSKLGAGSFAKVFGYLDEPLLSRCAEWTRSAEYLRRLC